MIDSPDEQVVLVDLRDNVIGVAAKLDVHRDGRLHRAVSVMIVDRDRRLLLQRRADAKYHSGGLWSNTCCGHPRSGESALDAAHRRLRAEMGIEATNLRAVGHITYRSELPGGLVEHEVDHVFVGTWVGEPVPNADEVSDWQWVEPGTLRADLRERPARYTAWLPKVLAQVESALPGAPAHSSASAE